MKTVDLSGKWQLFMDKSKVQSMPKDFPLSISLPNTTSNARLGEQNPNKDTGYLTDTYAFEGFAWFKKDIFVDEDFTDKNLFLFLERTRKSILYIDGVEIGSKNSLCSSHKYKINSLCKGAHTIIIRVDNTDYPTRGGHMTSPDTQTNWNGITGKIELQVFAEVFMYDVRISTVNRTNSAIISAKIFGKQEGCITVSVKGNQLDFGEQIFSFENGELSCEYNFHKAIPLWDEFSPELLTAELSLGAEKIAVSFGVRELKTDDLALKINGNRTFLRGKHDGLIFPLTGFAPTDIESWTEVLSIAKSYGINHYRFHTCCPPDAAFTAADMLGIYMEPELPFWGTITDENDENHNETEQEYLISEGYEILRQYGNHPSFIAMSLGNELWGSKDRLNKILSAYKAFDNRHLYTSGSNNFQFDTTILEQEDFYCGVRFSHDRLIRGSYAMCDAPQGHIQTNAPDFAFNYDYAISPKTAQMSENDSGKRLIQYGTTIKEVEINGENEVIPHIPVISHEVGQYETYPNFEEEVLYTGSLKPFYLDYYREKLTENNIFHKHKDFFKASGKLAVQCYKSEIETAMRSENLSGFQLLDLQDFTGQGVALVGILNAFMRSKGLISSEKWREFCNHTVVLAELEKLVYSSNEKLSANVLISTTKLTDLPATVNYAISDGAKILAEGHFNSATKNRITKAGMIEFTPTVTAPAKLTLSLNLHIENDNFTNSYDFYVYPSQSVQISAERIVYNGNVVHIANSLEAAVSFQRDGMKVLYVPEKGASLEGTYCTDFWCYSMFKSISESMNKPVPIGTMGLLIDNSHKVFDLFPTDEFTTPQWYEIVTHSHCEDLTNTKLEPIVWCIDNPHRCNKLGLLYEIKTQYSDYAIPSSILVCTSRLWEVADKREVKQFAASICNYLSNNK